MPNASRAGVPPEVIAEWKADFKKKKAEQKKAGGKKLPSGAAQYTYNGVTYTAKWSGSSIGFPEASYEAANSGARGRNTSKQRIKLSSVEQMMVDNKYDDARLLTEESGIKHVVDHNVPVKHGGFSNAPWNLNVLKESTNAAKSDKVGGPTERAALAESAHNTQVAEQLRQLKAERGAIKFQRSAVTGLAAAGIAALGPLGTAVSAAETAGRKEIADETGNPVDRVQQYISGASLAADVASYAPPLTVPATIVSTGLDAINVGIDTTRGFINLFTRR